MFLTEKLKVLESIHLCCICHKILEAILNHDSRVVKKQYGLFFLAPDIQVSPAAVSQKDFE